MKHKPEEPYNAFDDIFFWLNLACMDFIFGFDETIHTESNASGAEPDRRNEERAGENKQGN
jgi:hypothetical protein